MAKKKKEVEKKAVLPLDVIRKKRTYYRQMGDIRSFFSHLLLMGALIYVMFFVIFGIAPVKNDDMKPKLSAGDLMLYYRLENKFQMVFCIFRLSEYYTISANALATCHINTGGMALPICRYA